MKREDAVAACIAFAGKRSESSAPLLEVLDLLAVIGFIKFDEEPRPATHVFLLCNAAGVPVGETGIVLESQMIAALRAAGYEVRKSGGPKWDPVRNFEDNLRADCQGERGVATSGKR